MKGKPKLYFKGDTKMDFIERQGNYLKKCRKFLGMSRKDMALELGCRASTIANIETGNIGYYSKYAELYRKYMIDKIPAVVAVNL